MEALVVKQTSQYTSEETHRYLRWAIAFAVIGIGQMFVSFSFVSDTKPTGEVTAEALGILASLLTMIAMVLLGFFLAVVPRGEKDQNTEHTLQWMKIAGICVPIIYLLLRLYYL